MSALLKHLDAPWGYDVRTHTEVIPKPPPFRLHWTIGPVTQRPEHHLYPKPDQPWSPTKPILKGTITMQLTADQQVALSITGEDAYNNKVDISGDVVWVSSDDTILTVTADPNDSSQAVASAVGPAGTASVTVSDDVNADGSGDFQGSLAVDVVAGNVAEIVIQQGDITNKA